ncbi:TPA: hypothetical protein RQK84_004165 [Vibrio vulnificus]|nr:hypothetical protein [Vibrio vulnificus]HDY8016058.1 hypothetical protein [Vibrio vulnificus]
MFKKNHIHVQFKTGEVKVTHLETDKCIIRACSALAHPRTLMGDFFAIESCLKEILADLLPKKSFSLAPIAIVQFLEKTDGGVTNVEIRAFREAILGAGSKQVYFPESAKSMSKTELKGLKFSQLANV